MSDLKKAQGLLSKQQNEKALDALVATWRKWPLPRLADLIEVLDAGLAAPFTLLEEGKKSKIGSPLERMRRRVTALAKNARDPRFARVLLELVRDMPFTSTSSRPMWLAVFAALNQVSDPRVPTKVLEAQKGWTIRANQREWLDARVELLMAQYRAQKAQKTGVAPKPTTEETKLLDAIESAISGPKGARGSGQQLTDLLAAIYADPDDDGIRAVYGDALSAKNDPRGEFIALQLLATRSPAQDKRARELLEKHERAWIGPLEPIIAKEDVVFRRGFLAECKVKLKNEMDARKYGSDPSWATIERVRFTGSRFSYQAFSSQASGVFHVDRAVMKSLRDVNLHDEADLAKLLAVNVKDPWRIERIATSTETSLGKRGLDALAKAARVLPKLCAIEMMAPPRNWLGSAFFATRLHDVVLGLSSSSENATALVARLRELEQLPALESVTFFASRARGTYPRWTFTRDTTAKRKFSIATITPFAQRFDEAVSDVEALPVDLLTQLTVTGNRALAARVDAKARAAMTTAVKKQTRLAKIDFAF